MYSAFPGLGTGQHMVIDWAIWIFNPLRTVKDFALPFTTWIWLGSGNWNHSLWQTMTCLFYIVITMAADDLAAQWSTRNIPNWASEQELLQNLVSHNEWRHLVDKAMQNHPSWMISHRRLTKNIRNKSVWIELNMCSMVVGTFLCWWPGTVRWSDICMYSDEQVRSGVPHWGRDKIAAKSQTTFSDAFSSMKTFDSQIEFRWNMFRGI